MKQILIIFLICCIFLILILSGFKAESQEKQSCYIILDNTAYLCDIVESFEYSILIYVYVLDIEIFVNKSYYGVILFNSVDEVINYMLSN